MTQPSVHLAEASSHDDREADDTLTAENVAQLKGVTREEQDSFGVRSQNLVEQAIAHKDDGPRAGVTLEKVAQLEPVFRPDGTVTAGNGGPLNGAAAVIMSDTKVTELGLTPLARIASTGVGALSPETMGLSLVEASKRALVRAGMSIDDIDLVEINEALAAQVIPSARDLGVDFGNFNVNAGTIAVGHPFGITGARITSTLINSLQFHDKQFGLETTCVGGDQRMAIVPEGLS